MQRLNQILRRPMFTAAKAMLRTALQLLPDPRATSLLFGNDVVRCYMGCNVYGRYCVPKSSRHRPAAQTILAGGVWEPDTIEFIVNHAGAGDIVHAGTYFGDFIPALSRACVAGRKVWAFEPNPENYRCARITAEINNLKNVEINNAALGAEAGLLAMNVSDESGTALGGASRLVGKPGKRRRGNFIQVDVVTLDNVVPAGRDVTILQLDVEGFERQALTGGMAIIKRCKPILILEHLPEHGWLSENVLSLGYRIDRKTHDSTILTTEV